MELLILVNSVRTIAPDQTTAALILRACRRGWTVRVAGLSDLAMLPSDTLVAKARTAERGPRTTASCLERLRETPRETVDLESPWTSS